MQMRSSDSLIEQPTTSCIMQEVQSSHEEGIVTALILPLDCHTFQASSLVGASRMIWAEKILPLSHVATRKVQML